MGVQSFTPAAGGGICLQMHVHVQTSTCTCGALLHLPACNLCAQPAICL